MPPAKPKPPAPKKPPAKAAKSPPKKKPPYKRKSRAKKKPPAPRKNGPAPYVPDPEIGRQIRAMSELGATQVDMALILGLPGAHTIRNHYKEDFDQGYAAGNMRLRRGGMDMALGRPAEYDTDTGKLLRAELAPDKTMSIFLHKVRLGYRDSVRLEHTGADGGAIKSQTQTNVAFDLSKLTDAEFELFDKLRTAALARGALIAQAEAAGEDGQKTQH